MIVDLKIKIEPTDCGYESLFTVLAIAKIIKMTSGGLFGKPPKLVLCAPAMYNSAPLFILRCQPLFFTVWGLLWQIQMVVSVISVWASMLSKVTITEKGLLIRIPLPISGWVKCFSPDKIYLMIKKVLHKGMETICTRKMIQNNVLNYSIISLDCVRQTSMKYFQV